MVTKIGNNFMATNKGIFRTPKRNSRKAIQEITLDKKVFGNRSKVKTFARRNKLKSSNLTNKNSQFGLGQVKRSRFKSGTFSTIKLGKGINARVGVPK